MDRRHAARSKSAMLLPPPAYGVVVTGATGDPMRCPSCNHDNSVDASFCDACGAKPRIDLCHLWHH